MAGRVDPFKNFRFLLEIDGIVQAGFSDCSGYGSNVEVVEYREGNVSNSVHKLPGKVSYPDITMKWGITNSRDLYDWHLSAVNGKVERKNGSIILQDDAGVEQVRWNFFSAWASKYAAPELNAKGNDVAIETLTVSCERLERAS